MRGSWRPLPGERDRPDPRRIGESLPSIARRLGAPEPSVLSAIFGSWEELVGPAIAVRAQPLSLSHRVLTIGTDQPGWATQLRFLAPQLLDRLSAVAGEGQVERVDIRVVPPKRS